MRLAVTTVLALVAIVAMTYARRDVRSNDEACAERGPEDDPIYVAFDGARMTTVEAAAIDQRLARSFGDDVDARLRLLGFWNQRAFRDDDDSKEKHADHVIWFIEHEPTHEILGTPVAYVSQATPAWGRVAASWERALASPDVSPRTVAAAAHFFMMDKPRSKALLELGERVEPSSPHWATELGMTAIRPVHAQRDLPPGFVSPTGEPPLDDRAIVALATEALGHYERALTLTAEDERFFLWNDAGEAALEARRIDDAVVYADRVLADAEHHSDFGLLADLLHEAHVLRGRAASSRGDVDAAVAELLAAGAQASATTPLAGPRFVLANDLLARGRRHDVLAYLARLETGWQPRAVAKWRAAIERGERPHLDPYPFARDVGPAGD